MHHIIIVIYVVQNGGPEMIILKAVPAYHGHFATNAQMVFERFATPYRNIAGVGDVHTYTPQ